MRGNELGGRGSGKGGGKGATKERRTKEGGDRRNKGKGITESGRELRRDRNRVERYS